MLAESPSRHLASFPKPASTGLGVLLTAAGLAPGCRHQFIGTEGRESSQHPVNLPCLDSWL